MLMDDTPPNAIFVRTLVDEGNMAFALTPFWKYAFSLLIFCNDSEAE